MLIDWSSRPPVAAFDQTSTGHLGGYRRVYAQSEAAVKAAGGDLAGYLAEYDAAGVAHVVVKARDLETTFGFRIANADVAAFCAAQGPRFIGFAGVDPHKGMTALRELEHAVRELGLRGLNLQGFEHRLAIDDARMYPLYAKCIELDIPLNLHCGINFSDASLMEYGRPAALDRVMGHFPELRVCVGPPGFPWVEELIGVAWRHPNVHIGIAAVRPKYLAAEGSGYGALLRYGQTVLRDRIIWGSAFPMLPVRRTLEEVRALGLPAEVEAAWLGGNARRFLRLDGAG